MAASPRVSKGDKRAATEFVDAWLMMCRQVFHFPVRLSEPARELLEEAVGYLYSRREVEMVRSNRVAYASRGESLARAWVRQCRVRGCALTLPPLAFEYLVGQVSDVISMTDISPSGDVHVGDLEVAPGMVIRLYREPDRPDPSMN